MATGSDRGERRVLRVLVADDNAVLRTAIGAMLRVLGHRPDVVGDGLAAVSAAERADYDVVLLDVQMPVMGASRRPGGSPPAGAGNPGS